MKGINSYIESKVATTGSGTCLYSYLINITSVSPPSEKMIVNMASAEVWSWAWMFKIVNNNNTTSKSKMCVKIIAICKEFAVMCYSFWSTFFLDDTYLTCSCWEYCAGELTVYILICILKHEKKNSTVLHSTIRFFSYPETTFEWQISCCKKSIKKTARNLCMSWKPYRRLESIPPKCTIGLM